MNDIPTLAASGISLVGNIVLLQTLISERRYTIRRDPKTGRYLKKGR